MDVSIQARIQDNIIKYTKYIDIDTLGSIVDVNHPITIPKGKLIVAEEEAFFLLTGIFRGFYLDKEGNDITHHFVFENHYYASNFLTTDKPQVCSYEALEDCIVLAINTRKLRESMQINNQLLWLYVQNLEEAMKHKIIREMSLVNKNATERYIDFKQMYPGIEKRVNQIHIASYLGITPVSLSRIRRVIREEN